MNNAVGHRNTKWRLHGSSLEFPSVSGSISSETFFAINMFETNEDPMARQGGCLVTRSV